MDHATLVRVLESQRRLAHENTNLGRRQTAHLTHQFRERLSLAELHDQTVATVQFDCVISGNDVGMLELSRQFDFTTKALYRLRPCQQILANYLEGDRAAHKAMESLEHLAHAAAAEWLHQDVLT